MSRRAETSRKNLTAAEQHIRARQEAKAFELGPPLCPEQYIYNNKPLYAIWKNNVKVLLAKRVLTYADGEALLRFCKAQLAGQTEVMRAVWQVTWAGRKPFAVAEAAPDDLPGFLAGVAAERATFEDRFQPTTTSLCLDAGGTMYTWPEGDAATIARDYAQGVLAGTVVAGELIRSAAARFINDLAQAHERGYYFDPLAARHIVVFAEKFCKLALMPWQVFCLANIFGWKKASGARRFTEAYISVARKNGKTRLASVVALWLLVCDQEKFPEIYAAATKKEQARIVWKDAKRTVGDSEQLSNYVKRWAHELAVPMTDGSFTPLASEEKSLDGLRVHGAIADELHQWANRDVWDRLVKATVSRTQPLVVGITTAGESKLSFCWAKQDLAEKILSGVYPEDATFVAVYRIDDGDDYHNEAVWVKANPSLANREVLKPEHIRKALGEVEFDPTGLAAFLRFHLNVWPEIALGGQRSIPSKKWDLCSGLDLIGAQSASEAYLKFLELNRETRCFAGLDLGLVSDMTAFVLLFPRARFEANGPLVEKKVVLCQFYMPEVGLLQKEKEWGVPLTAWAKAGDFLELLPGDMVDPRLMRKTVLDAAARFNIYELGYDLWNAQVMCAEVNETGALSCVAVPQVPKELTAPARELLTAINRGDVIHFNNPVLAWHMGNVVLRDDDKGTKPEKLSANEKIDGVSATLNAWHRLLAAPPPSVYEKRGIVLI